MGFWTDFVKSFKERAENSKELNESMAELNESMAELKKLREAETFKKLKGMSTEGLSQLKNFGEKAATKGGEVTARVSGSVASRLGGMKDKVGINEKLGKTVEGTFDKMADTLNKARESMEKVGESVESKLKEKVPFVNLLDSNTTTADSAAGKTGGEAGVRSQLMVKTQEVQTAIEQRLKLARERLRATSVYKNALVLREKVVESDNPLVQRALDLSDSISRVTSKVFSETEFAKTIRLIHSLDPTFSTEAFKQQMVLSFVPTLRSAILSGNPEPMMASMTKSLADLEIEHIKERESRGLKSYSKLLNLDSVELRAAHTLDEGRPTLLIHFVSQENHCVRDSTGAVVEGAVDNIQDIEQLWAMQMNSKGGWHVIAIHVLDSRPSW